MERIFSAHSVANWMGPRAGVNVAEKKKSVVLFRTGIPYQPARKLTAVSWLLYYTVQYLNYKINF
jgi:hypothetical protein